MNEVQFKIELENIVDKKSVAYVVAMLSDICAEKNEHVLSNWQDETLAKEWDYLSIKLGRMSDELSRIEQTK